MFGGHSEADTGILKRLGTDSLDIVLTMVGLEARKL